MKATNACLEARAFVSGKALVNEMLLAAVLPVTGLNGVDELQRCTESNRSYADLIGFCRFDTLLKSFEYINASLKSDKK